jgi:HEPN domain-containing protein
MLALAQDDLRALQAMREIPAVADRILGFHAQQAIEKSLKAWIASLGLVYPFTHNLLALFTQLEEAGADIERFLPLARYSSFAVQFRYDQFQETGDALDRAAVIREVTEIVDYVCELLRTSGFRGDHGKQARD